MAEVYNYSIIIPHKNTPELLARCLDSIPRNDDIQIIVIDDNSDEKIVDFENFPGLEDSNIEVYFTKSNKGAGFARNVGLEHAIGRWLIFADADDYFTVAFYNTIKKYENRQLDVVFFGLDYETNQSEQGLFYQTCINQYNENDYSSTEKLKYQTWSPWAKMFNHKFIKRLELKFEERIIGNDCYFVLNANKNATEIKIDKSEVYCHVYLRQSLSYIHEKDWVYEKEKFLLSIWRFQFYKSVGHTEWQRGGVYSLLKSVLKKYGLGQFLNAALLAFKNEADFYYPLIWILKKKLFFVIAQKNNI